MILYKVDLKLEHLLIKYLWVINCLVYKLLFLRITTNIKFVSVYKKPLEEYAILKEFRFMIAVKLGNFNTFL
jgi:hypothetical protein